MEDPNKDKTPLNRLVAALNDMAPETNNGAVIMHFNKESHQLISISPLVQAQSVEDMYVQLSNCRDAIQQFLNDLVNKGLAKGDQFN